MEDSYYYEYSELILSKRQGGRLTVKQGRRLLDILHRWWIND